MPREPGRGPARPSTTAPSARSTATWSGAAPAARVGRGPHRRDVPGRRHGAAQAARDELSVGWLIGTARHKLIDHWRRDDRQRQALDADRHRRRRARPERRTDRDDRTPTRCSPQLRADHRGALTLRYLDGLPVNDVARILDRSVHATESLLKRAKAAFRHIVRRTTTGRPHDAIRPATAA